MAQAAEFPGASGMAKIDSSHYLCVQDVKAHSDKPRLAILSVDSYYQLSDKAVAAVCEQGARQIGIGDAELGVSLNYEPLACDWPESFGGRSSDLEAVHAINGRPGEFLACESGYWEGKYGRLFHLRVSRDGAGWRAEVLRKYQLPDWFAGEVEGLACQLQRDGSILVVFGVRGGTPAYAPGRLHWAYISGSDPPDLSWPTDGSTGVELSWTNFSNNPGERAISDLFIDAAGGLWVAGAEDNGNAGAFRSYVWLFGTVSREPSYAISSYRNQQYYWRIDGLKIEAIAAPCTPGSPLCFATDDESYGGIWRPLPEAVTQY